TLTVELAHAHVHIRRSSHYWGALLHRKLQSLLVGAHCIAEPTLRNPYIRQADRGAECVGDVPSSLQTRLTTRPRLVRSLEIPARPGGKSQESGGPSAPEMVVLRHQVERPLGMDHGRGDIAQSQGKASTMHGDRTREE